MSIKRTLLLPVICLFSLAFITIALIGCGSSGGGGDTYIYTLPPENAPTNVTYSVDDIKRVRFDGDFVSKADHFTIDLDILANSNNFTVDGAIDIRALSHTINVPVHRLKWDTSQYAVASCSEDESSHLRSLPQVLPSALPQALIGYFKASNTMTEIYWPLVPTMKAAMRSV